MMATSPFALEELLKQRTYAELLEKLLIEAEGRLAAIAWLLERLDVSAAIADVEEMDELTADELRHFEKWLRNAFKGVDREELAGTREAAERLTTKLLSEADQLVDLRSGLARSEGS
jgi:CRISPR/Cas system-associated protein Cas5 (RAMP superfamily)